MSTSSCNRTLQTKVPQTLYNLKKRTVPKSRERSMVGAMRNTNNNNATCKTIAKYKWKVDKMRREKRRKTRPCYVGRKVAEKICSMSSIARGAPGRRRLVMNSPASARICSLVSLNDTIPMNINPMSTPSWNVIQNIAHTIRQGLSYA